MNKQVVNSEQTTKYGESFAEKTFFLLLQISGWMNAQFDKQTNERIYVNRWNTQMNS